MSFHCAKVMHFKFNIHIVIHNSYVAKGATPSKRLGIGPVQVNPLSWELSVGSWVNPLDILSFCFKVIINPFQIFLNIWVKLILQVVSSIVNIIKHI